MNLEQHLRSTGRKILAPYVTCGFPSREEFPALVAALPGAGADMIEIGVPFTDPLMDGPLIQRASQAALAAEMRPPAVLQVMDALPHKIPYVLMTYVNPVLAMGYSRFASEASQAGASGVIVPDLPAEEAGQQVEACREQGLAAILLAAPTTPQNRLETIARLGSGFVYCVSSLGVTGVRESVSGRARSVVESVRRVTDRPALVGLGVSTPAQAAEVCSYADGVIVGSAFLKAVTDDGPPAGLELIRRMRNAIDE